MLNIVEQFHYELIFNNGNINGVLKLQYIIEFG